MGLIPPKRTYHAKPEDGKFMLSANGKYPCEGKIPLLTEHILKGKDAPLRGTNPF